MTRASKTLAMVSSGLKWWIPCWNFKVHPLKLVPCGRLGYECCTLSCNRRSEMLLFSFGQLKQVLLQDNAAHVKSERNQESKRRYIQPRLRSCTRIHGQLSFYLDGSLRCSMRLKQPGKNSSLPDPKIAYCTLNNSHWKINLVLSPSKLSIYLWE